MQMNYAHFLLHLEDGGCLFETGANNINVGMAREHRAQTRSYVALECRIMCMYGRYSHRLTRKSKK